MMKKLKKVCKRFCQKLGINLKKNKFIFNGKSICLLLTLAESGMSNNSKITVIESESNQNSNVEENSSEDDYIKYNILFASSTGLTVNMAMSQSSTIENLIRKYLIRIGKFDILIKLYKGEKCIVFIFNANYINVLDKTKIKDFFKHIRNPRIMVNDTQNLIGV